ncbi:MAG TPA: hypothetical protein GX715_11725 [Armatimonadetes bacterium]|nr:hypothetical protein [Armatimonadota bacterium]
MIYRNLGKTGFQVSVIGFGGMRFFTKSEEEATATVHRAFERGINFFETGSYGNGKSEEMLGKALWQVARRDQVILADKARATEKPTAASVRAELEASLKRYQTDYFDIFNFWGTNTPEMHQHILEHGALEAALQAREEGLIRAIGLTTHARPEWIRDFVDAYPWECIVLKEHMLYSRNQEVIDYLGSKRIGVVVMTPLAGGVVATPSEEIRAEVAREGLTPAQLGLRTLIANPNISSAISGMTSPSEVDENVEAARTDGPLTPAEQRLVDSIRQKTQALGERFCTGCGYCMPCPQEVNIPGIFRLWNLMRGYGNAEYSKLEYQKIREQRHWADFPGRSVEHCVECGTCEEKCPERLSIIDDLKRAHAELTAQ